MRSLIIVEYANRLTGLIFMVYVQGCLDVHSLKVFTWSICYNATSPGTFYHCIENILYSSDSCAYEMYNYRNSPDLDFPF